MKLQNNIMKVEISLDKKHWYTASIKELWIITQWDNFDELIKNLHECLELNKDMYNELDFSKALFQFNLEHYMHASKF